MNKQDFDLVLKIGRVMDPATQLDAILNVGIKKTWRPVEIQSVK
jgi:hypothetical protein